MKRDILCVYCSRESSIIRTEDLYIDADDVEKAGGVITLPLPLPEEIKKVAGQALETFRCDLCNCIIKKGEYCVARSVIGYEQTYIPWEHRYVEWEKIMTFTTVDRPIRRGMAGGKKMRQGDTGWI